MVMSGYGDGGRGWWWWCEWGEVVEAMRMVMQVVISAAVLLRPSSPRLIWKTKTIWRQHTHTHTKTWVTQSVKRHSSPKRVWYTTVFPQATIFWDFINPHLWCLIPQQEFPSKGEHSRSLQFSSFRHIFTYSGPCLPTLSLSNTHPLSIHFSGALPLKLLHLILPSYTLLSNSSSFIIITCPNHLREQAFKET